MSTATHVLSVLALSALLMWAFVSSEKTRHICKILYLVVWLLFSTVLPVCAIFAFQIPRQDYFAIVFTISLTMAMTFVWWQIALPELRRSFRVKLKSIPWWAS